MRPWWPQMPRHSAESPGPGSVGAREGCRAWDGAEAAQTNTSLPPLLWGLCWQVDTVLWGRLLLPQAGTWGTAGKSLASPRA